MSIKPKTHAVVIGSVLLLIGIFSVAEKFAPVHEDNPQQENTNQSAAGKEVPLIMTETKREGSQDGRSAISYTLPTIKLVSNQGAADNANRYIARFLEDAKTQFENLRTNEPSATGTIDTLTIDATTALDAPSLVTIAFSERVLVAGMLRPSLTVRYLTFDLANDRIMPAAGFFVSDAARASATLLAAQHAPAGAGVTQNDVIQAMMRDDHIAYTADGLSLSVDDPESSSTSLFTGSVPVFVAASDTREFIAPQILAQIDSAASNIEMAKPE